MIQSYRERSN